MNPYAAPEAARITAPMSDPDRVTDLLITLRDSASPDYGSGASVFGVGLVLILGLGLILLGIILMLVWRKVSPAFFRGETLHKDTPVLVID